MPDVSLVFDVHVFLGAISKSKKEESSAKAYGIMIKRYHKFFCNKDILKRYRSRSYNHGMTSRLIQLELEYLKQAGVLVRRKTKKVRIDGFKADDQAFLETACNGASYLLTRDRDFHDNKKKIRNAGCKFEVTVPDRYVERYEE